MIFAGAIGNLYDRIVYKAVPDFIDFHVGEFHWFILMLQISLLVRSIFYDFIELIDNNKK